MKMPYVLRVTLTVSALIAAAWSPVNKAADKTTVRIAFSKDYAPNTPELQMGWMQGIKSGFEKENPNVNVELVPIQAGYDDLVTKMSLMLSSSSKAPDVAQIPAQQTGEWAANGLLSPLDDRLSKAAWWPSFADPVKAEGRVNGKVYAVSEGVNTSALYYSIDIFKKAGIATPWAPKNWQDILDTAAKIKKSVPGVYPLFVAAGTAGGSQGLMLGGLNFLAASSNPMIYNEQAGKWVVDSKGLRETLTFFQQSAAQGLFAPPSQMLNANATGNFATALKQGNIGIMLGGNYVAGIYSKGICNPCWPDVNSHVGLTPLPTSHGQAPGYGTASGGWSLVIAKKSAHPDIAWKLVDYMQRKENLLNELFVNGLVPPIPAYKDEPSYANMAPPYQSEFARILPVSYSAPPQPAYPAWAFALNRAIETVILKPSTSVDSLLAQMKSYVSTQVSPDKVAIQP